MNETESQRQGDRLDNCCKQSNEALPAKSLTEGNVKLEETPEDLDKKVVSLRSDLLWHRWMQAGSRVLALTFFLAGSMAPGLWTVPDPGFGQYPLTLKVVTKEQCQAVVEFLQKNGDKSMTAIPRDDSLIRYWNFISSCYVVVELILGVFVSLRHCYPCLPIWKSSFWSRVFSYCTLCIMPLFAILSFTAVGMMAARFPYDCDLPQFTFRCMALGLMSYAGALSFICVTLFLLLDEFICFAQIDMNRLGASKAKAQLTDKGNKQDGAHAKSKVHVIP